VGGKFGELGVGVDGLKVVPSCSYGAGGTSYSLDQTHLLWDVMYRLATNAKRHRRTDRQTTFWCQ